MKLGSHHGLKFWWCHAAHPEQDPVVSAGFAHKENTVEEGVRELRLLTAAAQSRRPSWAWAGRTLGWQSKHCDPAPGVSTDLPTTTHLRCSIKNKPNSNHLLWNGLALELCNSQFLLKITVLNGENNLFVFFNDKLGKSLQRYCVDGMYS